MEKLREYAQTLREDVLLQKDAGAAENFGGRSGTFVAVEDGYTFLSPDELDEYRELKITLDYENGDTA